MKQHNYAISALKVGTITRRVVEIKLSGNNFQRSASNLLRRSLYPFLNTKIVNRIKQSEREENSHHFLMGRALQLKFLRRNMRSRSLLKNNNQKTDCGLNLINEAALATGLRRHFLRKENFHFAIEKRFH